MNENEIFIKVMMASLIAFMDDGPKSESDISECFPLPDDVLYEFLNRISQSGFIKAKDGIYGLTPRGREFLVAAKKYKALVEEHNKLMNIPDAWFKKILEKDTDVFE